ncbi:MAG: DNA primase [Candidatus Westeberhardia cardiocondylae]|nr:DNA primase [Candidatus Westeberhardia cardiocondylae]
MRHIPRVFITELLMYIDIVDFINSRMNLINKGKNFYALCPFHKENNPSFIVNKDKQFYYCFGCGSHGNVIDFIMNYDKIGFVEAIEELSSLYSFKVPYVIKNNVYFESFLKRENLYVFMNKISEFYQKVLYKEKTSKYLLCFLKSRGLNDNIIKEFSIGYSSTNSTDSLVKNFGKSSKGIDLLNDVGMVSVDKYGKFFDRFIGRVIFPMRDVFGRIVAFGGRSILGCKKPKYLNSPETSIFHKTSYLYGLYDIKLRKLSKLSRLIVVEGYMDVVTLRKFGIYYVVALLGTSIAIEQIRLLYSFTNQLIFCYDGDIPGRSFAWRTLEKVLPFLTDDKKMKFIFLPNGEDPDSLIRKIGKIEFEKYVDNSENFSSFLFQYLMFQVDLQSLDGRIKFGRLSLSLINKIPGKIFRLYLCRELGCKIGVPDEYSLKKLLTKENSVDVCMYSRNRKFTVMRILISLLIQNPNLFIFVVTIRSFNKIPFPGLDLFVDIVKLCKTRLNLTTGQVLEYYRNSKCYYQIKLLTFWEHMINDDMVEVMFIDSLVCLYNSILGYFRDVLISKGRISCLTEKDRKILWFLNKILVND